MGSKSESSRINARALTGGELFEFKRVISYEDIQEFARLSGDFGRHHVEERPAKAHALLVISALTKIGGDLSFLVQDMHMQMHAPVLEGEAIHATLRIESVRHTPLRTKMVGIGSVRGPDGTVVMSGTFRGSIMNESAQKAAGRGLPEVARPSATQR